MSARVLFCRVLNSSHFIANYNTEEQGRVMLDEVTTLDIGYQNCIMYLSTFRFPNAIIKIESSQIGANCTPEESSITHFVELDSGILDLSIDGKKYGGEYQVTEPGTLTSIIGTSTLPKEFMIKFVGSGSLNIDALSAGINIVNGIVLGPLLGGVNHYVRIANTSGLLTITEAYTS